MTREQHEAKAYLAALADKGGNLAIAAAVICFVVAIAAVVSERSDNAWAFLFTGLLNLAVGLLAWALRTRLYRQLAGSDSN